MTEKSRREPTLLHSTSSSLGGGGGGGGRIVFLLQVNGMERHLSFLIRKTDLFLIPNQFPTKTLWRNSVWDLSVKISSSTVRVYNSKHPWRQMLVGSACPRGVVDYLETANALLGSVFFFN